MTRSLRIAVADDERDTREYLQEMLNRMGHQVVTAQNGRQLAELCLAAPPDVIITDIKMPDMDGIAAADQVCQKHELPVILISGYHDAELLARAVTDHIMAYLVKPISQADVEAALPVALMRFEQYQKVRKEAADLRQALEDRKAIERAKGAIMTRLKVSEPEAFRRLQRLANDKNQKLIDAAHIILKAEEVFHAMDPGKNG